MSKEENKKTPKDGAKEATKDGAKTAPDQNLGFEYEFLPLAELEEGTMVQVAPKDLLVSKVDARDMLSPPDDALIESVKEKGILQAPVGTRVRDRKTGKEGILIVAGRRRRAAAEKNKIPEIEVKLTSCRNLQEYLLLAGTENIVRENMSYWDTACYFSKLLATGLKQTDIAAHFGEKTDGFVSQHLAVFKLDERVRKYVRDATQEPFKSTSATVVRELKRLSDGDIQTKFAMEAIENSWSPKILKAKVEVWIAKHNAEPSPKGKKGAKRTIKLPEVVESKDVQIVPKSILVSGYNYQAQRIAKLSSSEKTKDTTLAYEKGLLECLGYVSGLQKVPQQWKDYTPPEAE